MGPFKDCGCPYGEIEFAGGAAIETNSFAGADILRLAACRADRAAGPETRFKMLSGGFDIGELLKELKGAYCASAHWLALTERILQQGLLCVNRKIIKTFHLLIRVLYD
jgi:hypothetical protein